MKPKKTSVQIYTGARYTTLIKKLGKHMYEAKSGKYCAIGNTVNEAKTSLKWQIGDDVLLKRVYPNGYTAPKRAVYPKRYQPTKTLWERLAAKGL